MAYDVFLYNVPKVSEDGTKALPVPPSETKEFEELDAAKAFAAEKKDSFDRLVVIHREGEKQEWVERYVEGKHEVREEAVVA